MDFLAVLIYAAVGFVAGVVGALFLTQARVRQAEAAADAAVRARASLTDRLKKQESDLATAQALSNAALTELDILRQQLREATEGPLAPEEVVAAPVAGAAPPALIAAEPPPAAPAVAPPLPAEPAIAASTLAAPEEVFIAPVAEVALPVLIAAQPPDAAPAVAPPLPTEPVIAASTLALPEAAPPDDPPPAPANGVDCSQNPRVCSFCGSIRSVELAHLDHAAPNEDPVLIWTCHPCKTRLDQVLKRANFVRRSRPFRPGGARNWREWEQAVTRISAEPLALGAEAIEVIRATPPDKRAEFIASHLRKRRPAIPLTIDLKAES